MTDTRKKLDVQHRHILKLLRRDADSDGWVKVSDVLYPHLSKNMPTELVEFGGELGNYKAKLTDEGQSVLNAMEWLP